MKKKGFSKVARGCTLLMCIVLSMFTAKALDGSWELLVKNAGIASMHTQVTHDGTVVLLDRTNIGASEIRLPHHRCRNNPHDQVLKHDCTAHSVEFTPGTNHIRPLFIFTDTWCSSGQMTMNGTLVQTGGDSDGFTKVRTFAPCPPGGTCDWVESTDIALQSGRWYATNHILEDDTQVVIGGRGMFTMEFIPDNGRGLTVIDLLVDTNDFENDNYYPFVNLLPDGTLWIFANQDSIIYDYKKKVVVKTLPTLDGGPRNYPSAGSSVMLPLRATDGFTTVQVLVCGGAQLGAFIAPRLREGAQKTCGRITLTDANPVWVMEDMPYRRAMGDMVLLPSNDVLIINGAQNGSQGWGEASNPVYNPLLYKPSNRFGHRFRIQTPSMIPRLYHSTANLLPDGRILIAGSNTHQFYTFTGIFPTELRVEAFSPKYLAAFNAGKRPAIVSSPATAGYGTTFTITFSVELRRVVQVTMASAPFVTHSYGQGQRLLVLGTSTPVHTGSLNTYQITVTAPPSASVAPGGYYMTFVVNGGIPSVATWIQVSGSN
ncbi:unnamed protein product [Calypogeia fissa]